MATEGAAASLKVTPGWLNASTHNSKAINNNTISLKNEPINGLLIQPAAPDIASRLLPYMMLDTCGAAGARGRAYPRPATLVSQPRRSF